MRLATIRLPEGGTSAARVTGETVTELDFEDVGALLAAGALERARTAEGPRRPLAEVELAPVIPRPGKILCVGLNYRSHILEMGRELPTAPTVFTKYPEALVGPNDPVLLPPESEQADWEGELAVIVGATVRRADWATAEAAIAGYAVLNDVTMRDWQYRTLQWLPGKSFEATTPFGPELVTPDEFSPGAALVTSVDGEEVQRAATDDLVFGPAELIAYLSTVLTLRPGDVIATGTPGGVGHARRPARYLTPGQTLTTTVEGLGTLRNVTVADPGAAGAGDAAPAGAATA
ncbi:fumarylacetoacetate hydrolase family protein [Streptomyces triticirhizae]|uniref:FAA hydrolase family protein n=1 Tax=Streptomyces triticirhizae TaxID=2483353 RepID=A0A3M2M0S2_9ACTN|nr:fumarylacetoacetate hydrolase family protein [Streptomyces triticirhizae]RMI43251.1 FAA hydrolase family protein [Streptomyces triticirhizae]RMI44778.1 FAA hydrolase family protein [Streptomyces triticirhizae]